MFGYALGTLIEAGGYTAAHALARVGMVVLYAGTMAYFFSGLRYSIGDALLTVALFRLAGEHLIGAEWLFRGVESKTVAYALLFLAFGFAIRGRWRAAVLAILAATGRAGRNGDGMVLLAGLIGLLHVLLALPIAYLDRSAQLLGKFYLFRPSALAFFFALTALITLVGNALSKDGLLVKSLVVAALVPSFLWRTVKADVDQLHGAARLPERRELVEAVAARTGRDDVVLIEPVADLNVEYVSLHRELPRPTLVSEKVIPTHPADIVRWKRLLEMRAAVCAGGCRANRTAVPVRWLVTLRQETLDRVADCGPVVWRKGETALIMVEPPITPGSASSPERRPATPPAAPAPAGSRAPRP